MQPLDDAIRQSYLVRGMSAEEVEAIIALAEVRQFDGGAALVRQYDRSKDLMIILEGGARVNTFSGGSLIELGPGSILGEMALLDDQPRSATVMSVKGTKVAWISGESLRELMQERPAVELAILRNLSRVLCSYVRMANIQLDGQLHKQ